MTTTNDRLGKTTSTSTTNTTSTSASKAKLTAGFVNGLTAPPNGEVIWDQALTGFGLRTRGKPDKADWRWIVRYRHEASGKAVRLTLGSPLAYSPEEARRWAKRMLEAANTQDDPLGAREKQAEEERRRLAERQAEAAKPTIEQLWTEWRAAEGRLKKSARSDEQLWRDHIRKRLGNVKVADARQAHFVKLRDAMNAQPIVANRALALLSRMFTKAVEWGWRAGCAPEHPVKGVKRNPENRVEFAYTDEELGRILEAADADCHRAAGLAIRMLAASAGRLSEVLNARWDQIEWRDDGRAVWTVSYRETKNARTVTRVLPEDLSSKLREWEPLCRAHLKSSEVVKLDSPAWIFPQAVDPSLPLRRSIWGIWERIKKRAGVKQGRIHDLRHTVATLLTEETGSLEAAFHQLGHATMLTTRRYAHLTAKARTQASDIIGARLRKAEATVKDKKADVVELGSAKDKTP